jgi:hypothetical protein
VEFDRLGDDDGRGLHGGRLNDRRALRRRQTLDEVQHRGGRVRVRWQEVHQHGLSGVAVLGGVARPVAGGEWLEQLVAVGEFVACHQIGNASAQGVGVGSILSATSSAQTGTTS